MGALLNPGFEAGVLTPWLFRAGGGNAGSLALSADPHVGAYAAVVRCTAYDAASYIWAGQECISRIQTGVVYTASVFYKNTIGFGLMVNVQSPTIGSKTYSVSLTPSSVWKQAKLTLPAPFPADTTRVLFFIKPYGVGTIIFDDADFFAPTPPPPPPPPTHVLSVSSNITNIPFTITEVV